MFWNPKRVRESDNFRACGAADRSVLLCAWTSACAKRGELNEKEAGVGWEHEGGAGEKT